MTNANSFKSAVFVLLLFGVIYFVALGLHELKKLIKKQIESHREKKEDE